MPDEAPAADAPQTTNTPESPTANGTDWMWCYENPIDAAAEIDRLREKSSFARAIGAVWLDLTSRAADAITAGNTDAGITLVELRSALTKVYPSEVEAEDARWQEFRSVRAS